MSCFNAGQDGGHSIFLPYAQVEVILKRYAPRIIILEFDPASVECHSEDYEKLSILLPYYSIYPDLRPLIRKRSWFEEEKHLSAIYPFNSNLVNILRYNTNSNAARKKDLNGYLPMNDRVIDKNYLKQSSVQPNKVSDFDTNKLTALKNIIQLCQQHNVFLLIANSPKFSYHLENQHSLSVPERHSLAIIHHEKVIFLDFSNDPVFAGRTDLFADRNHLNLKGATYYSAVIAGWIKKNSTVFFHHS